jgi:hypothetical protein
MIKMLMTKIREFIIRGVTTLPLKENLILRLKWGKGGGGWHWLPQWKKVRVVKLQKVFMFPRGFIFRMIILLNFVEPSSLVAGDSVLLVENLGGICLVCQIQFQWNGIFNDNISRWLQTSFELGDMKYIMHP